MVGNFLTKILGANNGFVRRYKVRVSHLLEVINELMEESHDAVCWYSRKKLTGLSGAGAFYRVLDERRSMAFGEIAMVFQAELIGSRCLMEK